MVQRWEESYFGTNSVGIVHVRFSSFCESTKEFNRDGIDANIALDYCSQTSYFTNSLFFNLKTLQYLFLFWINSRKLFHQVVSNQS